MSGKVFEQPLRIRWNHCDPAGIVYHPQYFVMLNNAMEDFFRVCGPELRGEPRRGLRVPDRGDPVRLLRSEPMWG